MALAGRPALAAMRAPSTVQRVRANSAQLVGTFQVKATPKTSVANAATAVIGKVTTGLLRAPCFGRSRVRWDGSVCGAGRPHSRATRARQRTELELSGAAWSSTLSRYIFVSDDVNEEGAKPCRSCSR